MFENEKVVEKKTCKNCNISFEITDKDLEFYEKISPVFGGKKYLIPSPTLCPDCREQRRLSFRNERFLYKNKCKASGKDIISIYSPDKPYKIFDQKEWWSDKWNPLDYGKDFDFDTSFFKQFDELIKIVPHFSVWTIDTINCGFCNISVNSKDCYAVSGVVESENSLYGNIIWKSYFAVDGLYIYECNTIYECIDCYNCFNLFYSQNCRDCSNSKFLLNCIGCTNCIGCVGLKNKTYYIFNKQYSKEEYEKISEKYKILSSIIINEIKKILENLSLNNIYKSYEGYNNTNFSGDNIYNSNEVYYSFDIKNGENCKYISTAGNIKNSYDCSFIASLGVELGYESIMSPEIYNSSFCFTSNKSINCLYCFECISCSNLFGCVGLRNKSYCILNKQYTKEEYERIVPKIIEHMMAPPQSPSLEREARNEQGEWGEFFPSSISPFGYNETVANEYFPLEKNEILKLGFKWKDEEDKNYNGTFYKPLLISYYNENIVGKEIANKNINEILNGIIKCEITGKPFRIIKQELDFYIKHNLPIPQKHPDIRHLERMKLRNPRKLFDRICSKCGKEIKSTYSPDRKEIVYCENCYEKEVG